MKYIFIVFFLMFSVSAVSEDNVCPPGFELNFGDFFTGGDYCDPVSEFDLDTGQLNCGKVFVENYGFYDIFMHLSDGVLVVDEIDYLGPGPEDTIPVQE
jgi:hypothetical protein